MADCFISHATVDEAFANWVAEELGKHNVSTFVAGRSLIPGEEWSKKIRNELEGSRWVIFLCSHAAARSAYVQQELGMALGGEKNLIPVVWDMDPAKLPGWVDERQALDLREADALTVRARVEELAQRIHAEKRTGLLIGGALLLALVALGKGGG